MKIILLRHGKPNVAGYGRVRSCDIPEWIELYNTAGLVKNNRPSRETAERVTACNTVVCSNLLRSVESAKALGAQINISEPIFREAGLPYGDIPFLKMQPNIWAAFFRLLWFVGYSANGESFEDAKARAASGADRLEDIAETSESVLLVGHGIMNRLIARELLSRGWEGPKIPGKKYWDFEVYKYSTDNTCLQV